MLASQARQHGGWAEKTAGFLGREHHQGAGAATPAGATNGISLSVKLAHNKWSGKGSFVSASRLPEAVGIYLPRLLS
jgi:hypothetical protein